MPRLPILLAALLGFASAPAAAEPTAELIKRKTDPNGYCFADDVVPPSPALWAIEDTDTTLYLFGTVHILPEELCWQDERVTRAIWASDELVTETDVDTGVFNIFGMIAEASFDRSNRPLRERLDARHHATLDRLLAEAPMPLPESFYDKIDSWALTEYVFQGMLVPAEEENETGGVEGELEYQFEAARKPQEFLESLAFQIQLGDSYSRELQDETLDSWFAYHGGEYDDDLIDKAKGQWEAILEQWRTGEQIDLAAYMAALTPDFESDDPERDAQLSEEYLDHLLYARNRHWVDWIEDRLERPGTVFIAVGAAHLGGERSVLDYARQRGLPVRRLD
ncbi:TraB/GumN family protein [Sphingomicrobium arenosum]|uniref:TraB/GumN family protein n=1 Tax=Sphingomicrobium arenosum TaxID=2233861 RepID=UPI00224036D8|nr:TraB/GumN family protein [Sphingomicrobium arenosum]